MGLSHDKDRDYRRSRVGEMGELGTIDGKKGLTDNNAFHDENGEDLNYRNGLDNSLG